MSSAVSGTNSGTATGLGQGIDVTAFVTAALAGDQANITQIRSQQTAVNTQNTALTQITTELQALQSAAFSLGDPLGSLSSQAAKSSKIRDVKFEFKRSSQSVSPAPPRRSAKLK